MSNLKCWTIIVTVALIGVIIVNVFALATPMPFLLGWIVGQIIGPAVCNLAVP